MDLALLEPSRLPELAGFLNRTLRFDTVQPESLHHLIYHDPDHHPADVLIGLHDGRIVAACCGVLRQASLAAVGDTRVPGGLLKLLAVDPLWRRQGWATLLLERLEQRWAAAGARDVQVGSLYGRVFMHDGLDPRYSDAYLFLVRRGYARAGESFFLGVDVDVAYPDLDRELTVLAGSGFAFSRPAASEQAEVAAWIVAEFGHGWRLSADVAFTQPSPTLWICRQAGRILGFAAYDAVHPGCFGPTGVLAAQRGHGLGRILLLLCLRDMSQRRRKIHIPTDEKRLAFYNRSAGAYVDRVFWRMTRPLATTAPGTVP